MSADRAHGRAHGGGVTFEHGAELETGRYDLAGERARPQPQPRRQVGRPAPAASLEQAGGGGDRQLVGERPGQPQPDQVGHQREVFGGAGGGAAGLGGQLVHGVDRHRLDAGAPVELLAAHSGVGAVHVLGRRALVTVAERQPEHPVLAVEERVVTAPGIDPDAVQRPAVGGGAEAVQCLHEQPGQVPVQSVGQPHGPVGEAVADVEGHGLAVKAAEHHPAALGAEVDGRQPQGLSHPGLPMQPRPRHGLAAGPSAPGPGGRRRPGWGPTR